MCWKLVGFELSVTLYRRRYILTSLPFLSWHSCSTLHIAELYLQNPKASLSTTDLVLQVSFSSSLQPHLLHYILKISDIYSRTMLIYVVTYRWFLINFIRYIIIYTIGWSYHFCVRTPSIICFKDGNKICIIYRKWSDQ